jgi:acetolactate synthase-1/2/3 large subunit
MATCADVIAEELKAFGATQFFLFTGGDHALWLSFKRAGIQQVLARSEHGAVYMADAYARVTRGPAFVYGQYGPGAANVAGSLAEPFWSSSPVVVLASSMRRTHRYRLEYQELDQIPLFAAVTKWQAEAAIPEQIPHLLRAGVTRALEGAPGPVYVGIPNDLTGAEYQGASAASIAHGHTGRLTCPLYRPRASADEVRRALEILSTAARPLILAGMGVHLSSAHSELQRVVEAMGIPVVTSLSGKGAVGEGQPYAAGVVGRYSRKYANHSMKEADVLLAIGTSLGGLVTDSYRLVAETCKVIHVDIEPKHIGHNFRTELGVQADAKTFLEDLLAQSGETGDLHRRAEDRARWRSRVIEKKREWTEQFRKVSANETRPIAPEALISALQEELPADSLVLADTGYAAAWAGALYEVRDPGQGFIRSDGSLGWAMPAALGAQIAQPARTIIGLIGDGGFGYNVGELETAVRLRLPAIVIVLNNGSLAFEYHIQEMLYGEAVREVDDFADVDYAQVARAFGADGIRVETVPEARRAVRKALASERPVVIDAIIDKAAIAPVTRYDAIRERPL